MALDAPRLLNQSSADSLEARREVAGKALDAPCRFALRAAASNRPARACLAYGWVSLQRRGVGKAQGAAQAQRAEGGSSVFVQP